MAQIVPTLNLNKTPALVENNSLVFAKNIRFDVDKTIHQDYGIFPMSIKKGFNTNGLVKYDNILERIYNDITHTYDNTKETYLATIIIRLNSFFNGENKKFKIVGTITASNNFYLFVNAYWKTKNVITEETVYANHSFIFKYIEKEDLFTACNCNWHWSNGFITGCVINNLLNEDILLIGEYDGNSNVPFKSINLNKSTIYDDESIYTQSPNIPITNIYYIRKFYYTIPNGVYQFYVRYKIRDNFYTNWFPASKPLFVGNKNTTITSYGTLNYVNTSRDSDNSFVLSVEHLIENNTNFYESFQIGFILTHDDATYARAWKHFSFKESTINFDYNSLDSEELEINDLLNVTYSLYNVHNITQFKNKIYISNYTESNFDDDSLQDKAKQITIELANKNDNNKYGDYDIITASIGNENVISGLKIENKNKNLTGCKDSIIYDIINTNGNNIIDRIKEAYNNNLNVKGIQVDKYNIRINLYIDNLESCINKIINKYKNVNKDNVVIKYEFDFGKYQIDKMLVNGKTYESIDAVISQIYNPLKYITYEGIWVDEQNNISNKIEIDFIRTVSITVTQTITNNNFNYNNNTNKDETIIISRPTNNTKTTKIKWSYEQKIILTLKAFKQYINVENISNILDETTLIPYQTYKFYIHYVKSNGETSNGFYCNEITVPYKDKCDSIIYPIFKNIIIPEDYEACFFSIVHSDINTSTLIDCKEDNNIELSCIDLNTMLAKSNENLTIYQDNKKYTGKYYYSSDISKVKYFGADGVVVIDNHDKYDVSNLSYVTTEYSIANDENTNLIQCTCYLNKTNLIKQEQEEKYKFSDYSKMNLLGYLCEISKLDRDKCIKYYNDGSTVYYKQNTTTSNLNIIELSKYNSDTPYLQLSNFELKATDNLHLYSNYNLNYLTITEEPKLVFKTCYNRKENDTGSATEKEENQTITKVLRLINSQLMSDIYSLPNMYKTFTIKTYNTYNKNNVYVFNNTIRSSVQIGDENSINIIQFDPNAYYNIPTNKGIIVNLASIGETIIVHTKDSMFKFIGNNTLISNNGNIQENESEIFNTGISEIFSSDFGFAGIQNKNHAIIVEKGYIFFDKDAKRIYMYSGQGQIAIISDVIEKLFRIKNIYDVSFANDYYNNRIFISILFEDNIVSKEDENITTTVYYPITLSYHFFQQDSNFVSLHDFYYQKAFNTKTNCYFLTNNNDDVCTINKTHNCCYTKLTIENDEIYPSLNYKIKMSISKDDKTNSDNIIEEFICNKSIVDIIYNADYENIKTLNSISWCGCKIDKEFKKIDYSVQETLRMAEDITDKIPCNAIRIYTDTCMTDLCDCQFKSNDFNLDINSNYKYPRYNQGYWSLNYFRNILNSNNNIERYSGDNNSLIEGKYFVARFVFNSNFKFETINFNYTTKL